MKSNNFSLRLDIIKILAIFLIVFYHLYASIIDFANNSLTLRPIFPNPTDFITQWGFALAIYGYIGLSAFFIISGVGLSYSQSRHHKTFLKFISARLVRIFPLYWIILVVTVLTIWRYEPARYIDPTSIWVHVAGIHTLYATYMQDMNGPLWFIGAILQLYLLFPLMHALLTRYHPVIFFAAALLLKVAGMWLMNSIPGIGTVATIYLPEFAIGMFIGKLWAEDKNFRIRREIGIACTVIFATLLFLLSTNKYIVTHGVGLFNYDALAGIALFFALDYWLQLVERFIRLSGKKEWLLREWAKGTFLVFMTHILFLNYYMLKDFLWWKPILAGNFLYAFIAIWVFYIIVSVAGYIGQVTYDTLIGKLLKKQKSG